MNSEKVERARGDLNLDMNSLNNLMVSSNFNSQYDSFDSQFNTKTKSLSLLSDTQQCLIPEDIFPFYNEIDKIIFYHSLRRRCIYSEMKEYNNIEQIKNQRILVQQNKSSKIIFVMDADTQQLMVIKEIQTYQLNNAIQKLDEYLIHYKMNQMYPQSSLKLFIPVQIKKNNQTYIIAGCLERAQFNLYDYSRKYQITKEHAYYILIQILQQIINMHSINIAHRDVKPQNIFYVLGKGWLLSDFGESQVYEEVESFYNIRGTIYFLLPSLKVQITKNEMIKQNLLFNDIYGLVISIIMIQSQEYITNIQEEIEYSNDKLLKDLLKLYCLNDVKMFLKHINSQIGKIYEINESPIYMNYNQYDAKENQKMIYKSCIQLYCYYQQNCKKVQFGFRNHLLELIEKFINKEQIMTLDEDIIYAYYNQVFQGYSLSSIEPHRQFKHFSKYSLEKQKLLVQILYQFGFNEKTIYYGKKILKQSYSQSVHQIVIYCYSRIEMKENFRNESILFDQQLQLDQLDTDCQLLYIFTQEKNKHLLQAANQKLLPIDSYNIKTKISQVSQNYMITVQMLINYLTTYCRGINMKANQEILQEVISYTYRMPIQLQQKFFEKVLLHLYLVCMDRTIRIVLVYDLEEIFDLLDDLKSLRYFHKKLKNMIFDPDSYQEAISFQPLIYLSKIGLLNLFKNKKFNHYIQKIVQSMENAQKVKINIYKLLIVQNLLSIIQKLFQLQNLFQNHSILFIIKFGIEIAFQNNYHQQKYDLFQIYTIQVVQIMFELRNSKRMVAFIKKYNLITHPISQEINDKIKNNSILCCLKTNLRNKKQNFIKTLEQIFIVQQYLDRF